MLLASGMEGGVCGNDRGFGGAETDQGVCTVTDLRVREVGKEPGGLGDLKPCLKNRIEPESDDSAMGVGVAFESALGGVGPRLWFDCGRVRAKTIEPVSDEVSVTSSAVPGEGVACCKELTRPESAVRGLLSPRFNLLSVRVIGADVDACALSRSLRIPSNNRS